MSSLIDAAGRKPDEVIGQNVLFGGYHDDERAVAFARKMTKAGFVAMTGPRKPSVGLNEHDGGLAEALTAEEKSVYRWTEIWWQYPADATKMAGLLEKLHNTIVAMAFNRIVRTNASSADVKKVIGKHRWEGKYILDPKTLDVAAEQGDPSAMEPVEVIHEPAEGYEHLAAYLKPPGEMPHVDDERGRSVSNGIALYKGRDSAFKSYRYVAYVDGKAVSVLQVLTKDEKRGTIGIVYTLPSERGRGWGRKLLARARSDFQSVGHSDDENLSPAGRAWAQRVGEENAAELSELADPQRIPWIKVERDPTKHTEYAAYAERYGVIRSATQVYAVCGADLMKEDQEVFLVLPLNLRGELKAPPYEVARGQRSKVTVEAVDVLRAATDAGAEGYVVVHNHPTGKVKPSPQDLRLTSTIKKATAPYGKGLCLIDHVIVGHACAYSIFEEKLYKCP